MHRVIITFMAFAMLFGGAGTTPAREFDLSTIERTIAQQPRWHTEAPRFALFVVSPEKKVWFVVDGDDLYADLNGNGNLAEEGEKLPRLELSREERAATRNYSKWQIPDLTDAEGRVVVAGLSIAPDGNRPNLPGAMIAYFKVPDRQRAFVRPIFAGSPEEAPIVYPNGPGRLRAHTKRMLFLSRGDDGVKTARPGFHVIGECFVDGLGNGTSYLAETPALDCKLEFPRGGGEVHVEHMRLSYYTDWAINRSNSMAFPPGVVDGKVRITVSAADPPADKAAPLPFVFEIDVTELRDGTRR